MPLNSIYNIKGSSFHAFLQVYVVWFLNDSQVNVLAPMCCFPAIIGHQCFFSGELHSVLQPICWLDYCGQFSVSFLDAFMYSRYDPSFSWFVGKDLLPFYNLFWCFLCWGFVISTDPICQHRGWLPELSESFQKVFAWACVLKNIAYVFLFYFQSFRSYIHVFDPFLFESCASWNRKILVSFRIALGSVMFYFTEVPVGPKNDVCSISIGWNIL